MKDFKPFILEVNTRQDALILKTALFLMPAANLESHILLYRIQEGLGELPPNKPAPPDKIDFTPSQPGYRGRK